MLTLQALTHRVCQGSITLNLPDSPLFNSVKVALCVALFQSIAIQFFPAIAVLERWWMPPIRRSIKTHRIRVWLQLLLRSVVICVCGMYPQSFPYRVDLPHTWVWVVHVAGLAIGIPQLGLIISLIGSLGSALLALIFPPVIHSIVMASSLSRPVKVKNWIIMGFGVIGR
jgi:proton-coupled amino acid transporter